MQQCSYCNSTMMTRYWLRDIGIYLRCDQCMREFFDDGCPVSTRFELHTRIKSLEDKINHKDSELLIMKTKADILCSKVLALEMKLDEVYFAPDMPGYVKSQSNFACNNIMHKTRE